MACTGCIVDNALVLLDRSAGRYLLAPDESDKPTAIARARPNKPIVLSWDDGAPICRASAQEQRVTRARRGADPARGRSSLAMLARLRWLEWRYAATLRDGLDGALSTLEKVVRGDLSPDAAATLVASAFRARRLWSSTDRCLPRSMALTHALRAAGSRAELVLGVAMHPFAAHAWVQDGDEVLNDALDHVALFTPILTA